MGGSEDLLAAAEPLDGPSIAWARATARELGVDLIAGSILERVPGQEKLANTSVHIDPDGEMRAVYRKVHMFDVEVEGRTYRESALEQAGEEIVLSRTAAGVELGMSICYDLRFPELYRILALRGARVIAVPAAFTLATTRDHWETLVRARAIENQAFVAGVNRVGNDGKGIAHVGDSVVLDFTGQPLVELHDQARVVTVSLDTVALREWRDRFPAHLDADAFSLE